MKAAVQHFMCMMSVIRLAVLRSGVVVKFYLGDAKNLTTFFSEADIFDDPFLGREPTYHTNSLAQFLIHFFTFTLSQVRGSLVFVNCLVLVNLVATNLIWGDATAIASPLTPDYLGGCHPSSKIFGGMPSPRIPPPLHHWCYEIFFSSLDRKINK
jgi:hypothetical protein